MYNSTRDDQVAHVKDYPPMGCRRSHNNDDGDDRKNDHHTEKPISFQNIGSLIL